MNKFLKFAFLVADPFPTYRPDIQSLFGDQIAQKGHTVYLLTQSMENQDDTLEMEWHNMHVRVAPRVSGTSVFSRIRRQLSGFFHELYALKKAWEEKVDFLQVKDVFVVAVFCLCICRVIKMPFFYWLSFSIPELYKDKSKESKFPLCYLLRGHITSFLLYNVIARWATHLFVQSDEMKKDFVRRGIEEKKITPVPMGVNAEDIQKASVKIVPFQYVYIGAMDRPRHLEFILEVHADVVAKVPSARLYFVGSAYHAADVQFLKDEAERLGISGTVVFTGFLAREEAWKIVQESQVCLSPMHPSPMLVTTTPTKCMEYMALAKPVVGNVEIPDMKCVLEDSEGGICVPWDKKQFSEAVLELFNDPERAVMMGAKGQKWLLENREYGLIASQLIEKYYELLDEWKRQ